jgi:hypothetical protein
MPETPILCKWDICFYISKLARILGYCDLFYLRPIVSYRPPGVYFFPSIVFKGFSSLGKREEQFANSLMDPARKFKNYHSNAQDAAQLC